MKAGGKKGYLFSPFIGLSIFCSVLFGPILKSVEAAYQLPDFYCYYTEKIYLNLSTEMIAICFEESITAEERESLVIADPALKAVSDEKLPSGLVLTVVKEGLNKEAITQALERLSKLTEIKYCTPVFQFCNMKLILRDEFTVRFKPEVTEEYIHSLNVENTVEVVRKSPYRHNRYVLRVINPKSKNAIEAANIYNEHPQVKYGTPNFIVIGGYLDMYPDDTYFQQQWGMHNTGQTGGTKDADIDAPEAWDIATGNNEIIVAVIDTGVDYNHIDLAGNMWVNPGEIPGNDIDDDNSYVDDVYGWDFADDDNNPLDYRYHGTHCAGTVGAIGNNNEGVAGVCWKLKVMNLKVFPNYGNEQFIDGAIKAIEYGVDKGAKVLSNSWGGGDYSQLLKDEIEQAGAAGVLFVAAAGNPANGQDPNNDTTPHYPASYDCNNIIAVMATDHDDERSIWPDYMRSSAYGPISVDLGAPGTDILSTLPTYETEAMYWEGFSTYYDTLNGTSMAAPHVAGACALVWSLNPYLSHLEVKDILLDTVDKTLPGLCVSEGRLNLHNALIKAGKWPGLLAKTDNLDPNDPNASVSPADSITYTISFENNLKDPNDPNLPLGTLTNVTIVDTLPEEVDYEPTSDPNYDPNNHTYTWNIGTVEPNDSNSVTLTATVNGLAVPSGTILNICVIDANEIAPVTAIEITDVNAWVPDVIYVDKDANDFGTGLSWEKAFTDLQDGLEAAETYGCKQIWVAAANEPYTPTTEPNIFATFHLINGAALYGGFPSGGGQWAERNPAAYETVLSGNTDEDPDPDVFYLVTCSSVNEATIIDGFTITKGGDAGIRCENNASPTIRNNVSVHSILDN